MKNGAHIDNVEMIVFPEPDENRIGTILYEGDLGSLTPDQINFDTQSGSLSVIFNNGEEQRLTTFSPAISTTIHKLYDIFNARGKTGVMEVGFYQMEPRTHLPKVDGKSGDVTALVI